MSRGLATDLGNDLEASAIRPILFAALEFGGNPIYLCDQDRNVDWDGHTWLGNGLLRAPKGLNESADLKGTGAQVILSGVDSALLALVLNDSQQSDLGQIYIATLTALFAVNTPYKIFEGNLDVPEITDSGRGSTISINYESDLTILERSSEMRFTNECQQIFYPGDRGFEFITQAALARPFWGKAAKAPARARRRVKEVRPKKGGQR